MMLPEQVPHPSPARLPHPGPLLTYELAGGGLSQRPTTTPGRLPELLPTEQVWSNTVPTAHPVGPCRRRPSPCSQAREKQSQSLIPRCGAHRIFTWKYECGLGLGSRSRLGEPHGKSEMALNC